MVVSVVPDKIKIAETPEEAVVLQKYGIGAIDANTIERIVKVLTELDIKGINLVVTLRPDPQPAQQLHTAQQSHTAQTQSAQTQSHGKAPFDGLDEDQRWALVRETISAGKKLSMFGEVVSVDVNTKVWNWNGQSFKSVSRLANSIAEATGRRGQWNGWAILRITE